MVTRSVECGGPCMVLPRRKFGKSTCKNAGLEPISKTQELVNLEFESIDLGIQKTVGLFDLESLFEYPASKDHGWLTSERF